MSSNLTPSLVRTAVPLLIGPLFCMFGWAPDDPDATVIVSSVVSWLYYTVVRVLETYFPKLGYALGIAKAPAYSTESSPSPDVGEHLDVDVVDDQTVSVVKKATKKATKKAPAKRKVT